MQLTLRGLCVQYPFSQLILAGAKTIEARRYELGSRNIAQPGEELFLIETPPKASNAALTAGVALPAKPKVACVVGTVTFSSSQPYPSPAQFRRDGQKHRIREGAKDYDWAGGGEMHAWQVASTTRFEEPIPAGEKSRTG